MSGITYGVVGETPRNSVLLTNAVNNYRTVSLLVCKQSLLMVNSNRKAKARLARSRVARGQVASTQASVWQKEPRGLRGQESVNLLF